MGKNKDNPAATGRPPKLDAEAKAVIVEIVAEGLSRNRAAVFVGVSAPTIHRECKRDPEFRNALRAAEVSCERHHIKRIHTGEKTWQSSAWFLQRKWPKQYGEQKKDDSAASLLQLARSLASAAPPPGTTPGVAPPGAVQDDSRGPAVG